MPILYTFQSPNNFSTGTWHFVQISYTPVIATGTETAVKIYRSTVSGGPYTLQATVPINQSNWNDYAVTPGQTYYYVFTETDGVSESAQSAEFSGTVQSG